MSGRERLLCSPAPHHEWLRRMTRSAQDQSPSGVPLKRFFRPLQQAW